MNAFRYQQGVLHAQSLDCQRLAEEYGTPLYVYSRQAIEAGWHAFADALAGRPHTVCYAVKANSNIAVLNLLARLGSGFDIVSGGELERVLKAGGDPTKTIFSGVGKTRAEMARALEAGIQCFNVESDAELELLNEVAAAHNVQANISLRINPDVDAQTHPYIATGLKENKFGVPMADALNSYRRAADLSHIDIVGVDCHIGSQLTDIAPYADALDRLLVLIDDLSGQGIAIKHIDVGGGQGIRYRDEIPINLNQWVATLDAKLAGRSLHLIVEPGRAVVGNAGILLSHVVYLKHSESKNFAVVDAAMNDLIRPSLYNAWHDILPVTPRRDNNQTYDVVGPICESGDFLGKGRTLSLKQGDLLAVMSAGAYAFTMSSNYNTRSRAAEVIVDNDRAWLVRERESIDDLLAVERCLPG